MHLRGRENILKRLVVHSGAANLGLLMRKLFGKGTPRGLACALLAIISAANASKRLLCIAAMRIGSFGNSMAPRNTGLRTARFTVSVRANPGLKDWLYSEMYSRSSAIASFLSN